MNRTRLALEVLEDRTLLSGSPLGLSMPLISPPVDQQLPGLTQLPPPGGQLMPAPSGQQLPPLSPGYEISL
jgi:hypothetical protein